MILSRLSCGRKKSVRIETNGNGKEQQNLSELRAENETAVYRVTALQMRHELEKGCRIL